MTRRRLVTLLLVLGVVALFAVPLLLDHGSAYAGTDSRATTLRLVMGAIRLPIARIHDGGLR